MALYQIKAPHFTCGVVLDDYKVVAAAPIMGWARGMAVDQFMSYCKSKKYDIREVKVEEGKVKDA